LPDLSLSEQAPWAIAADDDWRGADQLASAESRQAKVAQIIENQASEKLSGAPDNY